MKTENYFALDYALDHFKIMIAASMDMNEKWTTMIDEDVVSAIGDLLKVLEHILDDERTPEIEMQRCDLLDI